MEVLRRYVFDPLTNSYKMRYVREVKVRRANDHQVVGDSVEAKDFYPLQTSNSFSDFGALVKQGFPSFDFFYFQVFFRILFSTEMSRSFAQF